MHNYNALIKITMMMIEGRLGEQSKRTGEGGGRRGQSGKETDQVTLCAPKNVRDESPTHV